MEAGASPNCLLRLTSTPPDSVTLCVHSMLLYPRLAPCQRPDCPKFPLFGDISCFRNSESTNCLGRNSTHIHANRYPSASLKHAAPPGVYVSLNPSDPSLWACVIFVRSGKPQFLSTTNSIDELITFILRPLCFCDPPIPDTVPSVLP